MPNKEETEPRKPRTGDLIMPPVDERDQVKRRVRKELKPPNKVGWLGYLALVLITIGVYAPIFNSQLVWSPYDQVERSSFESMEHIGEAWSIQSIRQDDPIALTSYFLEQKIPVDPAISHHAINLILHILAAILLLRILESLKLAAAFSASLVFAIHPAVLQTIFWAGYRTELIGLVLVLYALLSGIRNRDSKDFITMILCSSVAFLIHPASFVLPLVLGLAIFYSNKVNHLRNYNRLLPLICLALFLGIWTQDGSTGVDLNFGDRASIAAQNLYFCLKQALLPIELSLFYPFDKSQGYNVGAQNSLLPFLLFIPFFALIAFNYRKKWAHGIFLGLCAYLLLAIYGISKMGSFIDGSPAHEDHFQYIALPIIISLGICTAGGIIRNLGAGGKVLWYLCFTCFIIAQVAVTASFALSVSQPAMMWKNMSEQWPQAWLPKLALIESIQKEGGESDLLTTPEMIEILVTILDQQPERIEERILLTRIYNDAGQNNNALREYKRVLRESDPSDEFLAEAANFFDKLGLNWDANNARERITSNTTSL